MNSYSMDNPYSIDHYRELEKRLLALRDLFSTAEVGSKDLSWFEEYVSVGEYELVLHRLVDFLLDPTVPGITSSMLDQIRTVHELMELQDDCVEQLKEKADHRQ